MFAHPSYPYDDDSWREIRRYGQRKLMELGIFRDVKLTSDEWLFSVFMQILDANMIRQR